MPARYSEAQRVAAFWSKVKVGQPDECWPWTGTIGQKGYGKCYWDRATCREIHAHRVAFILSGGMLADGEIACHVCDNPPCCNPKHLFAGTNRLNMQDRTSKDRQAKGERQGSSRLMEQEVRHIRQRYDEGATAKELAACYGVSERNVYLIAWRKAWKHVL